MMKGTDAGLNRYRIQPDKKTTATSSEPKGWYSRGHLPHLDQPGLLQSITFRLHDSVPKKVIQGWKQELRWREGLPDDDPVVLALRRRVAIYEDAGYGACWLRDERIATLVEEALLHFDGQRYGLIVWCIMPNHVHVLIRTYDGFHLDRILQSWKSYTASKANEILGRRGSFWAREYFDRYIRDDRHFHLAVAYIECNPARAGLVADASTWRFGSAFKKA